MRVQFWGTRGSIAKPGPSTARYGGNTSCIEVRSARGTLVIVAYPPMPPRVPAGMVAKLGLEWQQDIDEWRSGEPGHPSRSDAIRCLIGMGLSAAYEERK